MKLFLIALSLYNIIDASYGATPCGSLPPGLEKLRRGVDAVSFDMYPEDVTSEPGLMSPIFDFTCDEKKKWANPAIPTVQYELPDQIESITHLPGGILDNKVTVMSSYHDRQKSHSNNVGLTLGVAGFGFNVGVKAGKLMQKIIGQDRTVTTVTGHLSAYSVEMKPAWAETMGSSMKSFLDTQAPNNYLDNPGKWQEFLANFGTHYFSTARFGGVFHLEVDTGKEYTEHHTEKDLSFNAGISYQSYVNVSGSHTVGKNATDKAFRDASNEKAYYYGGNANLLAGANGFQQWWDSAQANPWLFGGVLEPIINFIPAGPKKNAFQTAMDVKLDYAALDQMSTELGILKTNPYIDMATANSFVAQVNAERVKPIPPRARVQQLMGAVEGFINVQKTKRAPVVVKPNCQVVYDKKQKKNVCVNPTTCTCTVH